MKIKKIVDLKVLVIGCYAEFKLWLGKNLYEWTTYNYYNLVNIIYIKNAIFYILLCSISLIKFFIFPLESLNNSTQTITILDKYSSLPCHMLLNVLLSTSLLGRKPWLVLQTFCKLYYFWRFYCFSFIFVLLLYFGYPSFSDFQFVHLFCLVQVTWFTFGNILLLIFLFIKEKKSLYTLLICKVFVYIIFDCVCIVFVGFVWILGWLI